MQRGINSIAPEKMLKKGRVNIPGMSETIWQPLYDYQTKTAAATTSQRFFVDPIGTGGKTIADTNMELSGQIPKGQIFMITGIQVELYPGVAITAAAASEYADDILAFYQGGALKLKIGSKDFVVQGNLMKFPPVNRLAMESSVISDNAAAPVIISYQYASAAGREFSVAGLTLESNQNFSVELLEMAALPSGQAARVGVTLNGYLGRNAQ